MAVWLGSNDYDLEPKEKLISATSLLKSTRQNILSKRIEASGNAQVDVMDLFASRWGTALHEAVEKAWVNDSGRISVLRQLGIPQKVCDRVKVNPGTLEQGEIGMWLELRTERELEGWTVSGCADIILDGAVHDIKSTSVNMMDSGKKDQDYILQLSIYKWLNPDKVTKDIGYIEFILRDWSPLQASINPSYPQTPIIQKELQLLPNNQIEEYIRTRIIELEKHADTDEELLPECNDKELWMNTPKWQYFGSVGAKKASKNFNTHQEALSYQLQKGKGFVKEKKSKAAACRYCAASPSCTQRVQLEQAGLL